MELESPINDFNAMRGISDCSKVCHAPFQSLYFGQTGNIVACCYNRTNPLGRYPEQSIMETWTSKKAQAIRTGMEVDRAMKRLPPGCDNCSAQLHAGNFWGLLARKFDEYSNHDEAHAQSRLVQTAEHGEIAFPKVMEFELSNACNLECVMCHGGFSSTIRKNREVLPALKNPYDDEFVRQLEEFIPHLEQAKFLGGEPFMIKIYYDIWDKMIELKPEILTSITTNGSILNNRIKKIAERLNVCMVMSIDSLVRETYDKIRINSDFDQVQKSIAYYEELTARQGGDRTMSFATCPMTLNWKEMADLVRYCNAHTIVIHFNTVFFPRHVSLRYLTASELEEVVGVFKAELSEIQNANPNSQGITTNNINAFKDLVNQVIHWHKEAIEREEQVRRDETVEPDEWMMKSEVHLRKNWPVSELKRQIEDEWAKPDPAAREFAFLTERRDEDKDDFSFMSYYFYAVWLAYSDKHGFDNEQRKALREKVEFLHENWENYSDRPALVDTFLGADPIAVIEKAQNAEFEKLRYEPMLVLN